MEWAERERAELRAYLSEPRWFQSLGTDAPRTVAYFSPEFGITAALPQYSGGLGILAGDHLKAASDLGVPLIGVGLFYKAGYFAPVDLAPTAGSRSATPCSTPTGCRSSVLRRPDGSPVQVTLALPDDESLHARVWKAAVGRITLLLLDTDIPANDDELRDPSPIASTAAGASTACCRSSLLGIGGARAVRAFTELSGGPAPDVFHMNEGHAGLPRARAHRDAHRARASRSPRRSSWCARAPCSPPTRRFPPASTGSTAPSSSATSPARCSRASTRPMRSPWASSPARTRRRARSTWP